MSRIISSKAFGKFLLGTAVAVVMPTMAAQAQDLTLPTGESVVGGSASFDRSTAGRLDITQQTSRAVIEWQGFNIGSDATTQFHQPSSNALAVNRVVGGNDDPTRILGALKANGQVMVLDKNGVFFGENSTIDVGGIVASTGDVDTNAVMRGDDVLELRDFGDGSVVNQGTITVRNGGMAAFVAPHVVNNGVITARMGRVALAAEHSVATVDLYGDGLVEIALDDAKAQALSATNTGRITAEGGVIAMTAGHAEAVVDSVINLGGLADVSSVSQKGGKITIGGKGNTTVSGQVKADGATGGGQVDIRSTDDITVTKTASISADATDNGDGGDVILFADDNGSFEGKFSATGGANGGNGGFIETSAKNQVAYAETTQVDASAENGEGGEWLIDPTDVTVDAALANIITGAMDGDIDVTINTASADPDVGDITVASDLVWSGNGSLTMFADNDIIVNNVITSQKANGDGTQGAILLSAMGRIELNADVTTGRGNADLFANEQILVNNALSTDKGLITLVNTLGALSFSNDEGVRIGATGSITSNNKDINLTSLNGKMILQGDVNAGTGDVNAQAHTMQMWSAAVLTGKDVDIQTGSHLQQINSTGGIVATNLTGMSGGEVDLDATGNNVKNLGNFSVNDTFALKDSDGGLAIDGAVSSGIGGIDIDTADTGNGKLNLKAAGSLTSGGGNIDLTHNGAVTIAGTVDSTDVGGNGNVSVSGTKITMSAGSMIDAGNTGSTTTLTASTDSISQNAGSTLITQTLTGSSFKNTNLAGSANDVAELGAFATGDSGNHNGGFKLIDSVDDLNITGAVTSKSGVIELTTTDKAIEFNAGGSASTRDGASVGNITLDAQTNVTNFGGAGVVLDGKTVDITAQLGNIAFILPAIVKAETLKSDSFGATSFFNAAHEIDKLGESTIRGANFGYQLFQNNGAMQITGDITTNAGDVSIQIGGGAQGDKLTLNSGKKIATSGGDVTLRNSQEVEVKGEIDVTTATENAEVTLQGRAVELTGSSTVRTTGPGNATQGKLTLNTFVAGSTQAAGGMIETDILTGVAATQVDLAGTGNKIGEIDGFTVSGASEGFSVVNSQNLDIAQTVSTNGGDIDMDVTGDLNIQAGATVDAMGGNIDLQQTGVFSSVDANSVKTTGTGTIDLQQNPTGTVRDAVRAFDNQGTGQNTLTLGAGTFVETARTNIGDDLMIVGAGQGNTIITKDFHTSSGGTNRHWFRVNAGSDADFKDLTIDGAGRRTTQAIRFEGQGSVEDVTLSNINFRAATDRKGTAIAAVGDGMVDVTNVTMTNIGRHGVQYNSANAAGSTVDNLNYTGKGAGSFINRGVNINVTDNITVENSTFNDALGDGDPATVSAAVFVTDSSGAKILDNTMNNNFTGVETSNATGVEVKDNVMTTVTDSGIEISGSLNAVIEDNTITGAGESGIEIENGSNGTVVEGNTINQSPIGIEVEQANMTILEKNTVNGATSVGIDVQNTDSTNVLDNDVFDSIIGVRALNATNLRIEKNELDAKRNAAVDGFGGIGVFNSANAVILNNDVDDFDDGILIEDSNGTSVNKNTLTGLTTSGRGLEITNSTGVSVGDGTGGNRNTIEFFNVGVRANGAVDLNMDNNHVLDSLNNGVVIRAGSNNAIVEDTKVERAGQYGVRVAGSTDVQVLESDIDTVDDTAIFIESGSHNAVIGQNTDIDDVKDGIEVVDSDNITINDTTITGRTATGRGIELTNVSGAILGDGTNGNRNTVDFFNVGLRASGVSGLDMDNNRIRDIAVNGVVLLTGTNDAVVEDTQIQRVGQFGVRVDASTGVQILESDIDTVNDTAIRIENGSNNATLGQNNQSNDVLNGLAVSDSDGLTITNTRFEGRGALGTGVSVTNVQNVVMGDGTNANRLFIDDFATGMVVDASAGLIANNVRIRDISANAVEVKNASNDASLTAMRLNRVTGNGVDVSASTGIDIIDGDFDDVAAVGILLTSSSDAAVLTNNNINGSATAIDISNSDNANLTQNTLIGDAGTGIGVRLTGATDTLIGDGTDANKNDISGFATAVSSVASTGLVMDTNALRNNTGNTVSLGAGSNEAEILNNSFTGNTGTNIDINASDNTTLTGNTFDGGLNGVRLTDADATSFEDNDILNMTGNGIYASGAGNGDVELINNRFTDNVTAARFESGTLDLTGTANTFTNGATALAFDGATPALVGNTLGTNIFAGQTANYVELSNDAFAGQAISALNGSYDGFLPAASRFGPGVLTRDQLNLLESLVFDFDDDSALGNVIFGFVPGISDEDALSDALSAFLQGSQAIQVTFNGLPRASLDAASLNALNTFAGGDGEGGEDAADFAALEPAAGGSDTSCWGQFGDQSGAGSVTYSLSADIGSLMNNDGC